MVSQTVRFQVWLTNHPAYRLRRRKFCDFARQFARVIVLKTYELKSNVAFLRVNDTDDDNSQGVFESKRAARNFDAKRKSFEKV